MDINDTEFAKELSGIIRAIVQDEFKRLTKNLRFEVVGKIATGGSGTSIDCYINNSTTAVAVRNPRSFSLSAGQLVAVVYPNFVENQKYIDRVL